MHGTVCGLATHRSTPRAALPAGIIVKFEALAVGRLFLARTECLE
jgi:hypothetical protein